MADGEYIGLVDTDRTELRDRIDVARHRFDRLIRSADPAARPPGMDWTVAQVAAHMVTLAHRYRDLARSGSFHAATGDGIPALNQAELEAISGTPTELADRLRELEPVMDEFFDRVADDGQILPFHGGITIDGVTAQTNWLGELLMHGEDVARAQRRPWELRERDMLLVARGVMQIAPGFIRPGRCPVHGIRTVFVAPGARPYLMYLRDDTVEARECRPDDRPDAVVRLPGSTLTRLLYQRIGPMGAVRRGLRITGGRRPWRVLGMQSCIERV